MARASSSSGVSATPRTAPRSARLLLHRQVARDNGGPRVVEGTQRRTARLHRLTQAFGIFRDEVVCPGPTRRPEPPGPPRAEHDSGQEQRDQQDVQEDLRGDVEARGSLRSRRKRLRRHRQGFRQRRQLGAFRAEQVQMQADERDHGDGNHSHREHRRSSTPRSLTATAALRRPIRSAPSAMAISIANAISTARPTASSSRCIGPSRLGAAIPPRSPASPTMISSVSGSNRSSRARAYGGCGVAPGARVRPGVPVLPGSSMGPAVPGSVEFGGVYFNLGWS